MRDAHEGRQIVLCQRRNNRENAARETRIDKQHNTFRIVRRRVGRAD
jgi:hypothetical protein